LDQPFGLVSRW